MSNKVGGNQPSNPRRLCALVVDDDYDNAYSFAQVLQVLGCDAEFVTVPTEALAAAQRLQPQIVFLDLAMPAMSGYEIATLLRANFDEQMKIVAVTGFAGSEHRAASRRAGFDAHVSKPFDPELVRSILETLLPDR